MNIEEELDKLKEHIFHAAQALWFMSTGATEAAENISRKILEELGNEE